MILTSTDYTSLSRQELINLCREKNVAGFSHKKIHELIDLLVKAGVPPPGKAAAATATAATATAAATAVPAHHYIFNTGWQNVLPYLTDNSVQLILADPAPANTGWLEHGLRVLDTNGLFLIHGSIPQLPTNVHATEIPIATGKVLVLSKSAPFNLDVSLRSPSDLYELILTRSEPDAVTVIPFAADGATAKLVKRKGRSMIAMDAEESRVKYLYTLVA